MILRTFDPIPYQIGEKWPAVKRNLRPHQTLGLHEGLLVAISWLPSGNLVSLPNCQKYPLRGSSEIGIINWYTILSVTTYGAYLLRWNCNITIRYFNIYLNVHILGIYGAITTNNGNFCMNSIYLWKVCLFVKTS